MEGSGIRHDALSGAEHSDVTCLTDLDAEMIDLKDVLDVPKIQLLMDDFYRLTGVGMAIIDLKGVVLVGTGWQDICTRFHRLHPQTLKNCIESDCYLTQNVEEGRFLAYKCKNHLWDVVTPIFIAGKHVGNLFIGQFFYEDETLDYEFFIQQADRCGFDKGQYLSALARVPRFNKDTVESVMEFHVKLTSLISLISYNKLKLVEEVEERMKVEQELRHKEYFVNRILSADPNGVFIYEVKGDRITFINPKFTEIFGLLPDEIVERYDLIKNHIHTDDAQQLMEAVQKIMNSNDHDVNEVEVRVRRSSGEWFWIHLYGVPFARDKNGTVEQILVAAEDITKRKRAEEALKKSEEKYRTYVDHANEGIFVTDDTGHYIDVNQAACELVGLSRDELLGRHIADVTFQEDDALHQGHFQKVLEGGQASYYTRLRRKDGSPIHINISVVRLPEGRIMAFCSDITERKKAEEALRTSEENYRDLILHAPAAIYELDYVGPRFKSVNNMLCQISGYSREELLSRNPLDLLDPESRTLFQERIRRGLAGLKNDDRVEYKGITKDGRDIWFTISIKPLFRGGKLDGFLVVAHDITDLKLAEDNLRKANDKLTLLSSITRHDLKNQLTVLKGNLDLAKMQVTDPNVLSRLAKAEKAAEVIRTQLEFTKDYQELGTASPKWQKIGELCHDPMQHLDLDRLGLTDRAQHLEVYADPMLPKVFHNLIEDSIKYGGRPVTIRIDCDESTNGLLLIYEDDGQGVPIEEKERIFEKGFGKGTGLGLFLSREILAITGITIKEKGEPGKGARFEMLIPREHFHFF